MTNADLKPIVVVSQCLGFAAVRYNGEMLDAPFVNTLRDRVEFIQVCPELGIGLGVPRDPIRVQLESDQRRLVQPSTGRDLTSLMRQFADQFLSNLPAADGFILKSRSPSCGIRDAKIFRGNAEVPVDHSSGMFAEEVLHRFPHAAIEDEARLMDPELQRRFLVKLFAVAHLRKARETGSLAALTRFHQEHVTQFTARDETGCKALERIAENPSDNPVESVFAAYAERMTEVLSY